MGSNSMASFKNITREIFSAIAEIPFVLDVAFSRKSLYQKELLIGGFKPWQINHTLKRFQKTGYLTNKNSRFKLTKLGAARVNYYKLEKIVFTPGDKRWDGKWRIVVFDIPESYRIARDLLRSKLREWDCYKIQNSVFTCPYACEKELKEVIKILDIRECVHIFLTDDLGSIKNMLTRYYHL